MQNQNLGRAGGRGPNFDFAFFVLFMCFMYVYVFVYGVYVYFYVFLLKCVGNPISRVNFSVNRRGEIKKFKNVKTGKKYGGGP